MDMEGTCKDKFNEILKYIEDNEIKLYVSTNMYLADMKEKWDEKTGHTADELSDIVFRFGSVSLGFAKFKHLRHMWLMYYENVCKLIHKLEYTD